MARRALRFIPHTALSMRVMLWSDCAGIECMETEICVDRHCVPAELDPGSCRDQSCSLDPPVTPGAGGSGGGGAQALIQVRNCQTLVTVPVANTEGLAALRPSGT